MIVAVCRAQLTPEKKDVSMSLKHKNDRYDSTRYYNEIIDRNNQLLPMVVNCCLLISNDRRLVLSPGDGGLCARTQCYCPEKIYKFDA